MTTDDPEYCQFMEDAHHAEILVIKAVREPDHVDDLLELHQPDVELYEEHQHWRSMIIAEYQDNFQNKLPKRLPPRRNIVHAIPLKADAEPHAARPYRLSAQDEDRIAATIRELLDNGLIEPSISPWLSPCFLVNKKGGEKRMVIDYGRLNAATIKTPFALPRIDDLFDRLRNCKIFSKLDLTSGYHQLRVKEEDQYKTAFTTTRHGNFHWLTMPFGLVGAPWSFQRLLQDVLRQELAQGICAVYLDDVIIASKDVETHLRDLRAVLDRLEQASLIIKPKKTVLFAKRIDYLGHVLSPDGISVSRDKVKAILDWQAPKDKRSVRRLLGVFSYFRRFIKNYADRAEPISRLLKDKTKFAWTSEQDAALDDLKKALTSAPTLKAYDPTLPIRVETDASIIAIGAVLLQQWPDGWHPVAFLSRITRPYERHYPVHELELLALTHALLKWRVYLLGCHFQAVTDHRPLVALLKMAKASARVQRWRDLLSEFDMDIVYQEGAKNLVADALSRHPSNHQSVDLLTMTTINVDTTWTCDDLDQDRDYQPALAMLRIERQDTVPRAYKNYRIGHNDLLYFKDRLCVPHDHRRALISEAHDTKLAAHRGQTATYQRLRDVYFWPNMRRDVDKYINACDACQRSKIARQQPAGILQALPAPDGPWMDVAIDFITGFPVSSKTGNDAIMTVVDRFSKQAHFVAVKIASTAKDIARTFMREVVRHHGLPRTITSDRDPRFTADFWKQLWTVLGTNIVMTAAYHPSANGQVERCNAIIEEMLRATISADEQDSWDDELDFLEFAYNSAVHSATGKAPLELALGRPPTTPLNFNMDASQSTTSVTEFLDHQRALIRQVQDNIDVAQQRYSARDMAATRQVTFEPGDQVWIEADNVQPDRNRRELRRKLNARRHGPFKILERINATSYRIKLPETLSQRINPVFHVSALKLAVEPAHRDPNAADPLQESLLTSRRRPLQPVVPIDDDQDSDECPI